jgi:glycosyltransferase involved in cell wall biosynthesis
LTAAASSKASSLPELEGARVAIIHDWLTGMRGGERCLEAFLRILPAADIFTLFHVRGAVSAAIESRPLRTSFLQRVPGIRRWYRWLLPLFPRAVRGFDLSGYDLVLSLSHCVAKGARARGVPHISYCFTPMRYLYDQAPLYFNRERLSRPALLAVRASLDRLRRWDARNHPDRYVAISGFVADRIRRAYGLESEVLYPPVDVERFRPGPPPEDYYLIVSSLTPYKRIDLAVRSLGRLGRRLVVVGDGEERARLERIAGPTVSLLGRRPDGEVASLVQRCRAFILPGEEDFGIAPLEAMASGRPVIALGRGGAMETVVDMRAPGGRSPTGILFPEPSEESLAEALLELERREGEIEPVAVRAHAEQFSVPRFEAGAVDALRRFLHARG